MSKLMEKHTIRRHLVIGTVLAALFTSLQARACECQEPREPALPTGDSLDREKIAEAHQFLQIYLDGVHKYQQCVITCIKDLNLQIQDISIRSEHVSGRSEQMIIGWKSMLETSTIE